MLLSPKKYLGQRRIGSGSLAAAIAVATIVAGAAAFTSGTAAAAEVGVASAMVEESLRSKLEHGQADVIVKFRGKADLTPAYAISDSTARATFVYEALRGHSDHMQSATIAMLRANYSLSEAARQFTVLWVDNSIAIRGIDSTLLASLEASPNIDFIREQKRIELPSEPLPETGFSLDAVVPSMTRIKVPDVWALGFKGDGIVVANIDSGVRHTHQALVKQYRGNDGGTFTHAFNWYDPYAHSVAPRSSRYHGSHTMGTIVGDNGTTEQIGAAPGAKWMACIGFGGSQGGATDAGLIECAQWTIAPTDLAGTPGSADPSRHADVVNNSWGLAGCDGSYNDWYMDAVDGWLAAGVMPLFSMGNASTCNLPNNPPLGQNSSPSNYGKLISVGSTGANNGQYAIHSVKGPTIDPNPGLPQYADHFGFADLKPNVVAPGVGIRSASDSSDSAYATKQGTSMSAPAVAGVTALMMQAGSCLKGNTAAIGSILMGTAVPIPVATGSPSDGPGNIPNQATGWGEIDALAAVNASIAYCSVAVPPTVMKVFAPTQVVAHGISTLTITLKKLQTADATLASSLTDTLPSGVVVAATPNAATTCVDGTVTAAAGSS